MNDQYFSWFSFWTFFLARRRRSSPVLLQQTRNALFKAGDAGDQNVLQIEHVLHPWLATRSSFNRSMHARPRPFLRTCFREMNCSNLRSSASLEVEKKRSSPDPPIQKLSTAKTGCSRKVRSPHLSNPEISFESGNIFQMQTYLSNPASPQKSQCKCIPL